MRSNITAKASGVFKIGGNTVNRLGFGAHEEVLNFCEAQGIGSRWLREISRNPGRFSIASPRAMAPPKRSPVMLPIPGTSQVSHLEENVAAANVQLAAEEFAALDAVGKTQSRA